MGHERPGGESAAQSVLRHRGQCCQGSGIAGIQFRERVRLQFSVRLQSADYQELCTGKRPGNGKTCAAGAEVFFRAPVLHSLSAAAEHQSGP